MLEGVGCTIGRADGGAPARGTGQPETWRRGLLARLSALSLGVGLGTRLDPDADTATAATAAARAWLELIDAGRPPVSWAAASPVLRTTVAREDWEAALGSARIPLGACRSRKLVRRFTVEDSPGLPPGAYAVIGFEGRFSKHPVVGETVTLHLDADGRWRPAAYFIR